MTVYGGFDPGTFQGWSLNLFADLFTNPGVARGFQVTQTGTPSMAVQANLDATAQDGVVILPNGAWVRIDAVTTFSISGNSSGSTRTDALVAQVDPANGANFSLAVQANWSTGFTAANNNQIVIALISVANGASSIVNANITMTSQVASVIATGGSNSMVASDGVGLSVADNSTSSTLTVQLTGLTSGVGRAITIRTTDSSSIGHQSTFDMSGNLTVPGSFIGQQGAKFYPISPPTSDAIYLYNISSVLAVNMGAIPNSGYYAYDVINGGYIFNSGTKNGINFLGFVTTPSYFQTAIAGSGNNWYTIFDVPISGTPTITNSWRIIYNGQTGAVMFYDITHNHLTMSLDPNGNVYGQNGVLGQLRSNGGGAAGAAIWVGTTDPGANAGEGDIWINA